jgi:hypothetical protein
MAAALCRPLRVAVPEMPEAAYRASIPLGPSTGVPGGGGEPRLARVVEVDAVDANRLTPVAAPSTSTGVSGGGGEPLLARVVLVDAVDAKRLTWRDEASSCGTGGG